MWKGAISFGLVYVPVKLYAATEQKDIKFNYLHKKCNNPVQYRKFCPYCQTEVAMEDIVRGYEYEKGKYVILEDEDFEKDTANSPGKSIEILDFVDLAEIDPVYYEKSYYLAPGDGGAKVYDLLKRAMAETGKVAVARVMIRSRESLAAIRVSGRTIVMSTMHYPDEIRQPSALTELNYQVNLHDNEVKMAVSLINSLSAAFQPEKYTDTYRQGLMERIQAKIAGEVIETPARQETGKVVDLMEALKASINLAKEERDQKKAAIKDKKSAEDAGAEKITAAKTRARRKTS
jgi:DNA end-binding protein Ku